MLITRDGWPCVAVQVIMCDVTSLWLVQAGAQSMLSKFAKRMLYADVTTALLAWNAALIEHKSQLRGEGIMRRVGARMRNMAAFGAIYIWREAQSADKAQKRAEGIMRRVGGRMRNRDLSLNWAEWYQNYKRDILGMWKGRAEKLQTELDALQMEFTLTTQVPYSIVLGCCRSVLQHMRLLAM